MKKNQIFKIISWQLKETVYGEQMVLEITDVNGKTQLVYACQGLSEDIEKSEKKDCMYFRCRGLKQCAGDEEKSYYDYDFINTIDEE